MTSSNTNNASLPDYIDYDLKILSIGLNPSIPSIKLGYYFANPRNRFWKAFTQANLIDEELGLNASIHKVLLEKYSIGFTDVAKRASRMGHELRADDFKRDAPLLRAKIEQYQPKLLWFHGKMAIDKFLQYGYGVKQSCQWGVNDSVIENTKLFITPNPSPANAAFSLEDLVDWYRRIEKL